MHVLDFLNGDNPIDTLQMSLGIKVSQNEKYPNLYCLNYDQINSPKLHPIVRECRSLVLKLKDGVWSVSSRSFDRFFNYGEIEGETHNVIELIAHEKIDGSLIGLWYDDDYGWLYRTRSIIMPEGNGINGHELTWAELIDRNLGDLEYLATNEGVTFILEVVSKWNRVVTKYDKEGMYLLAIRENDTGNYRTIEPPKNGWKLPKQYNFNTIDACMTAAKELPNLEEGYVLYSPEGVPVVKVKSPAYVAAHRLRGEGTPTPRRIMDLIIDNEQDEYLSIFPEDSGLILPYRDAMFQGLSEVDSVYASVKEISEQKEFAMKVKDLYYSALLFKARKDGKRPSNYFYDLTRQAQYRFIEKAKEDLCQN